MNKLTTFLLCGVLALGTAACQEVAKTSPDAPSNTNQTGQVPEADEVRDTQQDANNSVREAQRQSDERARNQREQVGNNPQDQSDDNIESLVRNQLEREIPGALLSVDSEEGAVTIAGNVQTQVQLNKIVPVAKQVQGVKSVKLNVTLAPARPNQ